MNFKWTWRDLNPRPSVYETDAANHLSYRSLTTGCNFLRTRTGYTLLRRSPYTVEAPALWPSRNPHLHSGRVILFGIGLANDIK